MISDKIMREDRFVIEQLIDKFQLDLSGLTVYTEAANGAYRLTPILTALAGAEYVYAQTRDSRFGKAKDIIEDLNKTACLFAVHERIQCLKQRELSKLSQADIVTNSGFVRPIDFQLINTLKPSAVIPLMWETWEYHEKYFDLPTCKKKEILSLGTKEQQEPCDMRVYNGLMALKLLFEMGYDGGKILLLGNAPSPAGYIASQLRGVGIQVSWFSHEPKSDFSYRQLRQYFLDHGKEYVALIVAEHIHPDLLLGDHGFLDFNTINQVNSNIKIGIISGNIDSEKLSNSGIFYKPETIAPFGLMSYQPYSLGQRPILLLYTAGLKIGEVMSRARLSGKSIKEAAQYAIENSPAMDFLGENSWL